MGRLGSLAIILLVSTAALGEQKPMGNERIRVWQEGADDGSVHCLGNGLLCVYEQGPNIIQAFGPPYSTASTMRLNFKGAPGLRCESVREAGTAIWNHKVAQQDGAVGQMLDFVDAELPCFVREAHIDTPTTLLFNVDKDVVVVPTKDADGAITSLLLTVPDGRPLYNTYPMPYPVYYRVFISGAATVAQGEEAGQWEIRLATGTSWLYLVGGPSLPEVEQNAEAVRALAPGVLLARTRESWKAFTARRHDFASLIPASVPEREGLLRAIDDVAVIIKTQEARGGGVLAGYPYHLLYVRDQYGVARCLLRLGYFQEAKGILQRDWDIWKRHGKLHNAQAAGVDGVFHVHENDDVEITGYLILQAFDYAKASNDWDFLRELLPMLDWALTVQKKHLVHDMLPFNGDETYVAGGILPRNTLNDGSAEATLLYITGGERLLDWVTKEGPWAKERVEAEQAVLRRVRDAYRANFLKDGRYITNNPARKEGLTLPRFRHGVCEGCYAFGWTERNPHDRYVCPKCLATKDVPAAPTVVYSLQSVALMPFYIDAALPNRDEVAAFANGIVEQYQATGKLPSRPDGNSAVGYDFGLLLYTLAELDHPAAASIFGRMMSVVDATGAWVEYYEDYRPRSTRYRPWESGINLDAALKYVGRKYGLKL